MAYERYGSRRAASPCLLLTCLRIMVNLSAFELSMRSSIGAMLVPMGGTRGYQEYGLRFGYTYARRISHSEELPQRERRAANRLVPRRGVSAIRGVRDRTRRAGSERARPTPSVTRAPNATYLCSCVAELVSQ